MGMGLIRRVSIYPQFPEARAQGFVSIIMRKRELYISIAATSRYRYDILKDAQLGLHGEYPFSYEQVLGT